MSHTWGKEEHHIESKSQNTKAPKQGKKKKKAWCLRESILILAHGHGHQLLLLTFKIILGCK